MQKKNVNLLINESEMSEMKQITNYMMESLETFSVAYEFWSFSVGILSTSSQELFGIADEMCCVLTMTLIYSTHEQPKKKEDTHTFPNSNEVLRLNLVYFCFPFLILIWWKLRQCVWNVQNKHSVAKCL